MTEPKTWDMGRENEREKKGKKENIDQIRTGCQSTNGNFYL